MTKRVLIATGGTGGHVYPAKALADSLRYASKEISVEFIGGSLSKNRFLDDETYKPTTVAAPPIHRGYLSYIKAIYPMCKGIVQSIRAIRNFKPDVIVGFGSYHTVPTLIAAKLCRVPLILHEGNSVPGKVTRLFSRLAKVTGIAFPNASQRIRGRTLEMPMPLRSGYQRAMGDVAKARRYFGLAPDKFTFLVFGGSQGALALNLHFANALTKFMATGASSYQVLHFTGDEPLCEQFKTMYEKVGILATVRPYENSMDQAWLASDLAITRAGAMTIAEMLSMEVPAILVPYPFAADRHQDGNADWIVEAGCAIKLDEKSLDAEVLSATLRELVANDHAKLKVMKEAIRKYNKRPHGRTLVDVVCEMIGEKVR